MRGSRGANFHRSEEEEQQQEEEENADILETRGGEDEESFDEMSQLLKKLI